MKLRRVLAIARKETLQIVRDRRSLMIALLIPLMQMFMLGYGVSLDIRHIPLCVLDREASQASAALLARFAASPYFTLAARAGSEAQLRRALDDGSCRLALVLPADLSHTLAQGGRAPLQVLIDGTDSNSANIAASYARSVLADYSAEVQAAALARRDGRRGGAAALALAARVWYNEDLVSRNFIVPGIVALVMAIVGAQLTSLTIAREWERGTMELLISTPVQPMELMLGKLLPYFVVGLLDAAVCLLLAVGWFAVPFRGALGTLLLTSSLFLIVVLCIGYCISVAVRSQVGASQIALVVTMLPTTLLSGFAFPIAQMPAPVQAVTYLVSARYYVTILKDVFLKGSDAAALAAPIACLLLYALVLVALAARAFRKTLD